MKTINDLTEGLMDQFNKLKAIGGKPEEIKVEIDRSRAMVEIGNTVVNVAKTQIEFAKNFLPKGSETPKVPFFDLEKQPEQPQIGERVIFPDAEGGGTSKKN